MHFRQAKIQGNFKYADFSGRRDGIMKKTKSIRKILASFMVLCVGLSAVSLSACDSKNSSENKLNSASKVDTSGVREIYYLNFKPEIADKYEAVSREYEKKTGIKVKIETAAEGTYENVLTEKIKNSITAPTIFQLNGPVSYEKWKSFCADLSETEFYNTLSDKTLALKDRTGVYGIPYTIEGYGIIYNKAITDKYFASDKKSSKYGSMDEINSFDKLKELVEDMTKLKKEIGIKGVFGSTSLKKGQDWRWQTHLMNIPLYYEFGRGSSSAIINCFHSAELEFSYADNYKNIFDLYIDNSCTDKSSLGSKTVDDSMKEFALGDVAMVQNGNWAWDSIAGIKGNTVKAENIKYLPIYTGVENEEKQGICIGTENYFAINAHVDLARQQAAVNFLEWLFSDSYGKKAVINELGFIAPFTTFIDAEKPKNPLAKEVLSWMNREDIQNVSWVFGGVPSEEWKEALGKDLLSYAEGDMEWKTVIENTKSSWKEQAKIKNKK